MTKASFIALTAFVWTAAFAATGAVAHFASNSLSAPQISTVHLNAAVLQPPQKPQPPPPVEERVITMPTVEIVAQPPTLRPLHCHSAPGGIEICE